MNVMEIRHKQIQYNGAMSILSHGRRAKTTGKAAGKDFFSGNGFCSVTLLEEDVKAYYGTVRITGSCSGNRTAGSKSQKSYEEIDEALVAAVELPKSFDSLKDTKVYYHGKIISEYRLVQTAVAGGKMEISEDTNAGYAGLDAFDLLIKEPAASKYRWSTTKYSEDGKYTFTLNSNGKYEMHTVQDLEMGASLEEIANWICSGTPNRNIETRYLNYLRRMDPDLYNAAQKIGNEVRTYNLMTSAYDAGVIGDAQHDYDLSLLGIIFGEYDLEKVYEKFVNCKKTGTYLCLLEQYNPEGADYLTKLRAQQTMKTGGVI